MTDASQQTPPQPAPTIQPVLANDPAARSPDGTLKDASQISTATTSADTQTDGKPAAATDDKTTTKAPDSYADFTAPAGGKLDATIVAEATPIFRELGLDQAGAQRLVDFYNKQVEKVAGPKALQAIVDAQNTRYTEALKADPEIGGKLEQVKIDIGRAYDALGNPKLVADFKKAMDESPEGNRPEFIKLFHAMAQKMIEGKPVGGNGPSVFGQTAKPSARPSLAEAMYPHLAANRG